MLGIIAKCKTRCAWKQFDRFQLGYIWCIDHLAFMDWEILLDLQIVSVQVVRVPHRMLTVFHAQRVGKECRKVMAYHLGPYRAILRRLEHHLQLRSVNTYVEQWKLCNLYPFLGLPLVVP
jgi:hypothetical protein